jgi:hypothetical protein
MKPNVVYELLPMVDTPGYDGLGLVDLSPLAAGYTLISDFDPVDVSTRNWQAPRLAPIWQPREVVNSLPRQVNDYPCLGLSVPTFSQRAVDALRDLLEPNGEILPLRCDTGQYYAYNVTTVADVLNREASDIEWHSVYQRDKSEPVVARDIRRYEFHPDLLMDLAIFRIPEGFTKYFVTERFAERIREHGLRGFNLRKVWPLPEPDRSELEAYYRAKRQRKGGKGERPPAAPTRKGRSPSPNQRPKKQAAAAKPQPAAGAFLDLRRESEAIEGMLQSAIDRYAAKHVHPAAGRYHPPVRDIVLIYSVGGGYVHLRLDGWSDQAPDEGRSYLEFARLERPHWRQWAEPDEMEMVEVITASGERRWIDAEEELIQVIGQMLVEALKRARDTGMLSRLPMGQGCELGVEEIDWSFGWPSAEDRGRDNMVT